jgi:hypothetical protein
MDIIVNRPNSNGNVLYSAPKYLYFSNGTISESSTATGDLPVTKISISSIQIDPLKRIASFTISFWGSNKTNDNSIFLGQKSYSCNCTYTVPIINPTVFSITTYQNGPQLYTISIKDNKNGIVCTFTSLFPYYDTNSDLYVYYDQNTPWQFTGPTGINDGPTGMSFSKVDKYTSSANISNIDVWYTTPNGIQYLRTNVAGTNLKPKGTIKFLYSTDPNNLTGPSGPSVTTDSNYLYQFNMPDNYYVRSELQSSQSSYTTIKLNGYTNTIQKSDISVIGPTGLGGKFNNFNQLITGPTGTTGTYSSAQFLNYSGLTGYKFTNLQYTPNITDTTVIMPSVIISDVSDSTISAQYYSNPLNSNDIGIMDTTSYNVYNAILSMLQSTGPTGSFINTVLNDSLGLSWTTTLGNNFIYYASSLLPDSGQAPILPTNPTGPILIPETGPTNPILSTSPTDPTNPTGPIVPTIPTGPTGPTFEETDSIRSTGMIGYTGPTGSTGPVE